MIDPNAAKPDKLAKARKGFNTATNHFRAQRTEMREASRFIHNTGGVGQWETRDLDVLRKQKRAALTMNLTAPMVAQVTGQMEDHRQAPKVTPVGDEDASLAEVISAVLDAFNTELDVEALESQVFERGAEEGEHLLQIETGRDSRKPGWIEVKVRAVEGTEIAWDTGSRSANRVDARGLYWSKWMTREEFVLEYPEHEDAVDSLIQGDSDILQPEGEDSYSIDRGADDYSSPDTDQWVRRHSNEIRVVHHEYKLPKRMYYMLSPDGRQREVSKSTYDTIKAAQEDAEPRFEGVRVWTANGEEVRWFEFIANEVLYDDVSPEPFEGFSVKSFTFYLDPNTGYSYGIYRNARDPQRDVNKGFSVSLDHMAGQGKPGYIAEEAAVPNKSQFEDDVQKSGTVAIVGDGKLGMVKERTIPQFSQAATARVESAKAMLQQATGIQIDAENPNAAQDAATTQVLKEKKSIRGMRKPLAHFGRFQKALARTLVEIAASVMPDDQIASMIGDEQRYQFQDGFLFDTERQQPVDFRNLRGMTYNVELQPAASGSATRLLTLQVLSQLGANLQLPIAPDVLFSLASSSRAMRERLLTYAREVSQQQAQAGQQQQETAAQQLATQVQLEQQKQQLDAQAKQGKNQIDAAKASETRRHNRVSEMLERDEDLRDFVLELLRLAEESGQSAAQLQAQVERRRVNGGI